MIVTQRPLRSPWLILACLAACCGSGCTSVITSAYLRDAFWETAEHAAETKADSPDDPAADEAALAAADEDRRTAAIEEAVSRLSKLGGLDDAARTTLIETLERTSQEDWPAVVDAFAESLGDTAAEPAEIAERSLPEPHVVAKADLDAAATAGVEQVASTPSPSAPAAAAPAPPAAPEPPAAIAAAFEAVGAAPEATPIEAPASDPQTLADDSLPVDSPDPRSTELEPTEPEQPAARLAIRNACFATRVQAWGVVDRFASNRFRPGQDVIVYFELDGLTAGESPAGHTTCIDTTLRLTTADGTQLHDWTFEPIAETCRARRHDYFARYVVRIPESAEGGDCRLEISVTDTLSGAVADAALPLALASRPAD